MKVDVIHGDCVHVLRDMAEASVDAVCTDPPYDLPGGFMSKHWDRTGVAFRTETWAAVAKVMKPGAHLVAMGGTRTYHRLVCAIEDAGFEIRDTITWHYGSGFPKSLNVSAAIDKRPCVRRHSEFAEHLRRKRLAAGFSNSFDVSERVTGKRTGACANWEKYQFPEYRWWPALKSLLGLDDCWGQILAEAEREVVGRHGGDMGGLGGERLGRTGGDVTVPATDAAKRWQGWGTALKPSTELIVLARKPLACPTVAAQVLATGTGALNIDACRVEIGKGDGWDKPQPAFDSPTGNVYGMKCGKGRNGIRDEPHVAGRWPPNLCHDSSLEVLAAFATFGECSTHGGGDRRSTCRAIYGAHSEGGSPRVFGPDTGTAARFFPALGFGEDELRFMYTSKANKRDRAGSKHCCVKPQKLLRWLARLITPPGGTILDPFAGSGSLGEAAVREGFSAILIERELEYYNDIHNRLARLREEVPLLAEVAA